jgi:hypothetical protein
MGEFGKWLLHDDQKEVFDALFASVLTLLFFGLSALVLWPLGRATLTFHLLKGYWVFCIVMCPTVAATVLLQRLFRVDMESHFDAYVISGLIVGGFLQAGWSAFAALAAHSFSAGASLPLVVILYVVGFLSCYVVFTIVSLVYSGSIYRQTNLLLAVAGYVIFSAWPASGRALYGWFFDLF